MPTPSQPLAAERAALSEILQRLMTEINDLETLCKHAPRIVSVAVNAARVQAALEAATAPDDANTLRHMLASFTEEAEHEEETAW